MKLTNVVGKLVFHQKRKNLSIQVDPEVFGPLKICLIHFHDVDQTIHAAGMYAVCDIVRDTAPSEVDQGALIVRPRNFIYEEAYNLLKDGVVIPGGKFYTMDQVRRDPSLAFGDAEPPDGYVSPWVHETEVLTIGGLPKTLRMTRVRSVGGEWSPPTVEKLS